MAISIANKTTGGDTDGGATATTASITPGSNKLILLLVGARRGDSVQPGAPTVTGNGLTWVQVGTTVDYDTSGTSRRSLSVFRAMGSAPTAGTVGLTFSGNCTEIRWVIDEVSGMSTAGTNGSGAVVQATTNSTASANNLTVTLAAFESVYNATYGAFASSGSDGKTAGSGFAISGQNGVSTDAVSVVSEFRADTDTSVDYSQTSTHEIGGIAIEIRVAAVAAAGKYIDAGGIL